MWLAFWPVGAVFVAAVLRLLEHAVLHDGRPDQELTTTGRLLVELLSTSAQVAIVAAGVGMAMLWGARW